MAGLAHRSVLDSNALKTKDKSEQSTSERRNYRRGDWDGWTMPFLERENPVILQSSFRSIGRALAPGTQESPLNQR